MKTNKHYWLNFPGGYYIRFNRLRYIIANFKRKWLLKDCPNICAVCNYNEKCYEYMDVYRIITPGKWGKK